MKNRFLIALFAFFLCEAVLKWQGASLKTTGSPSAIIDLELATTPQQVHALLDIWDINIVKMNIWIDFVFIVAYVAALSIAAEFYSNIWSNKKMKIIGHVMAKIAFVAGFLDIAENLFMLQTLAGNYTVLSLQLTHYCAAIKFTLIGIVMLYLIISFPIQFKKNNHERI